MKKLQKGFTLIELMIVVAIIAILAAVAAPKFGQQLSKTRDAKAISIVGNWRSALNMNYADEQTYAEDFATIEENVDDNTVNKTYESDTSKTFPAANDKQAWTDAGTADGNSTENMVSFTITGTSIESSIIFDGSNGADTKGTTWSAY